MAEPITVGGSWLSTQAALNPAEGSLLVTPYWAGLSWDCSTCGIGYLLSAYNTPNLEYLHDGSGHAVSFRFTMDDPLSNFQYVGGITAWTNGVFGRRADGAFTYDSGTGHVSNSWDNPEQYALFRLVGGDTVRYFLGIEDILVSYTLNDHDHNDYIVSFTDVPEPSSLLLMGCAAAAAFGRRAWSRRTRLA
jgi:hypothetical protein